MFVTECAVGTTPMTPESARDAINGSQSLRKKQNALEQVRAIAGLCNSGEFDATTSDLPLQERKINGDATDQAILRFSESLGSVSDLRTSWKKEFELAFNSKNKFMIRTFSLLDRTALECAVSSSEASDYSGDI